MLKSGFVVVIGMSSVGKSTLLNTISKQKLTITTSKKQSTRVPQRIIFTDLNKGQIVFIDTPGYFKPKDKLEEMMLESIKLSISKADVILFLADITMPTSNIAPELLEIVTKTKKKKVLALTKVDKKHEFKIEENIEFLNLSTYFDKTIPISSINNLNIDRLIDGLFELLPEGQLLYPEDELTDASSMFIAAELVREAIFDITYHEIPYSTAVYCEEFKKKDNGIYYISCTIYVEHESQKGIIIGKDGSMIKKIGIRARKMIEETFEIKSHLELTVKVAEKWRKNDYYLKMFGYSLPKNKK